MDQFLAIEKILHFHHTTSRQPLRVAQVRNRAFQNGTIVTVKDFEHIRQIWPESYRVWNLNGHLVMDAPDLPHNVDSRRETFTARWEDKENMSTTPVKSVTTKSMVKPLALSNRRVLMGRLATMEHDTKLSLLGRVRAKEAMMRRENTPEALQAAKDRFLNCQVPKIRRVLAELSSSNRGQSLELSQIMDIMRTNFFKLGDGELERALQLLQKSDPEFCSIVTVGNRTHVRLPSSVTA